jgi:hypothetical protein
LDKPRAHIKYTADTFLRKHLSELSGREGGNAPFSISGVKVDKLVWAMYIAIARSEITLLLH